MMRAPKTQCGKLLIRMTQVRSVREKQEIHSSTDDVVTQILGTGGGLWILACEAWYLSHCWQAGPSCMKQRNGSIYAYHELSAL